MFSKNVSSKDEGTFNISPDFVSTPHQTIPSMCCGAAHVWRPGHCCTTITLDTLWNLAQRSSQYLQSPVTPALYKCALAVVTVAMTAEERFITLLLPPLVTRLQTADCAPPGPPAPHGGGSTGTHQHQHIQHTHKAAEVWLYLTAYCSLLAVSGLLRLLTPHCPNFPPLVLCCARRGGRGGTEAGNTPAAAAG